MGSGTVEIITGRERRRRWSVADKLRILAECDVPGVQVAEVAARHGVYRSLVFQWRRQARDGLLVAEPVSEFVPVRAAAADRRDEILPEPEPTPPPSRKAVSIEVADLEAAGISIIQTDEPAFREGLPLRSGERADYLRWAVAYFRLSARVARDDTQIHTHMC